MIETAVVAFTAFFAIVDPISVSALFAGMTARATPAHRRAMALRGTLIATVILLAFALAGDALLTALGITLPAMRTAGGILLLLIGIDMVFARHSGGSTATEAETREGASKTDISVFPLATPLIAGPGAMGMAILLMAGTDGDLARQVAVILTLLTVLAITLVLLLAAGQVQRLLGVTGLNVVSRVLGVLLTALAVQFIFDGIGGSGLLG
jgi:multiple antibiotic resistance protein